MSSSQPSMPILWRQVCGLAAVQGAISLAWIIYTIYLPDLLKQLEFPLELGLTLLIVENILAILMEPLMGGLSDRANLWVGTRLPLIVAGTIASSALFIAIPAVAIFGNPAGVTRWLLPTVIIVWSLAMTTFRSPAISLLRKYAKTSDLPQAASLLTLAGVLVGAIRPLAQKFILSLGAALTFAIGSFVLLGAVVFLRSMVSDQSSVEAQQISATSKTNDHSNPSFSTSLASLIPILGLLLLIGLAIALGVRLLTGEIFPRVLSLFAQGFSAGGEVQSLVNVLMGMTAIALGLCTIPAGQLASKFGNRLVMLASLAVVILGELVLTLQAENLSQTFWLAPFVGTTVLLLAICLSGVLNGVVPLALALMPAERGGLGVGMYFGGFSAGIALFPMLFPKPMEMITLANAGWMVAIAFALAGAVVWGSNRLNY